MIKATEIVRFVEISKSGTIELWFFTVDIPGRIEVTDMARISVANDGTVMCKRVRSAKALETVTQRVVKDYINDNVPVVDPHGVMKKGQVLTSHDLEYVFSSRDDLKLACPDRFRQPITNN